MSERDPLKTLLSEILLAVSMIGFADFGMYAHTGSMPPLVVVESSSMVHDIEGEIGSIDAGDLVLVHNRDFDSIVTFAEATDPENTNYGYEQHGLEGDVIIYKKNGEGGTPIIHRAIMEVIPNQIYSPNRDMPSNASNSQHCPNGGTYDSESLDENSTAGVCVLTWDVPGTTVKDVETVSVSFDGFKQDIMTVGARFTLMSRAIWSFGNGSLDMQVFSPLETTTIVLSTKVLRQ